MAIKPEQLAGWSETSQQQALFAWAAIASKDYPQLKWLHAIPNANSHRMVAEGVRGGVPDICLPHARPGKISPAHTRFYHGLYIEMKIESRRKDKNGGCSEDQLKWLEYLSLAGYKCHVCYGWIEARDRIMEYLNG